MLLPRKSIARVLRAMAGVALEELVHITASKLGFALKEMQKEAILLYCKSNRKQVLHICLQDVHCRMSSTAGDSEDVLHISI